MATAMLNAAGKKLFEAHMDQYAPVDPMYESYTDNRGKQRKRRRQLPPGLSARDAKILQSVQKRAHYLDKGFHICGIRFGWTFIIGLIPVVGDVADGVLAYALVIRKARQAEIPGWLLRHMLFNNAVSIAGGFVPFVGDVVLALYKANSRNAALLEEFLRLRGETYIKLRAEGKDPEKIAAEARAAKKKGKVQEKALGDKGSVTGKKGKGKEDEGKGKEEEGKVVKDLGKAKDEGQGKKDVEKGKDEAKGKKEEGEDGGPPEYVAEGITKNDVAQVQPGAGKESGEVISGTLPDGTTTSPKTTTPSWVRRLFSHKKAASTPSQGKFVENVVPSSSNGAGSGPAAKESK